MDHDAVPGLGLPLRWHQENQDESAWIRHRDNPFFASALDGSEEKRGEHVGLGNYQGPQPLTVAERRMLSLINDLTDRADWHRIVFDQQFVNEWKSSKLSEPHTTQRMLDWCISEVQDYAGDFAQTNIVPALDRGVFKSDNLLASALSDDLSQAMAQLQKDASHNDHASVQSNVTLQIVDPALYPFSFAKSPCQGRRSLGRDDCIEHCGLGHIIGVPQDSNGPCDGSLKGRGCYAMNHAWSLRYQWLPFEVKFNAEDPTTRYINNVHPVHHAGVYSVLEKIIDKTIPLFNRCLTSIETPSRFYKTRIDVECTEYGDVPNREPGEYQTLEARTQWHYLRNKSRERPSVDLRKDFRDSGLQFIVEASSINMDPLLPDWDGDCGRSWWKMQGQLNERICATVLYFYDCDDLQEGSIHFQQRVSNDEAMELNTLCETAETEEVYDIQDGRATIQELGVVDIRQGRMIAFPNVFVPLVPHGRVIAENGTDLPHQAECASSPGQNT
ncbi:MAG: hypothetical protein LQ352_003393 [Teloschistes flavicans]|nr:MAG: hypothetical protein LQ352_003393 [Teloschistes flavicans]